VSDGSLSAAELRLCEVVACLARRNIVYCDGKTTNVFVDGGVRGASMAALRQLQFSATLTSATQHVA
jgi:hypothetical protein